MQSAFAARSGLFAAFLASCGATGPRGALDGPYGLFALYEAGQSARALDGLGSRDEGSFASVKKFPTCACNHALTEAVLQLVEEFDLQSGRITSATARISPYMHRLVGARYEPDGNPRVAAQFSAQYSVASAVFRRRVGLADLEPLAANEPAVVEFARRVTIEIDSSSNGQLVPAEIEFVLNDGRRISRRVDTVPGGSDNAPASREDRRKIVECLERGPRRLSASEIDRLLTAFDGIEALPDVGGLFDSIRGGPH
jgi:2-methylcitrate dehydratase PrpD